MRVGWLVGLRVNESMNCTDKALVSRQMNKGSFAGSRQASKSVTRNYVQCSFFQNGKNLSGAVCGGL